LRGLLGSFLLATVATVVALVLAELAVRALPEPAPPPTEPPIPAEYRDLPELRSVRELIKPGSRGVSGGVLHRTNSLGVRGPEYDRDPPVGTFRIAVIGDSYTMGHGVEEQDAYPAVAESLLNARGDGVRYEVINLGVAGLAIQHSVRRLEQKGLWYRPHLIVYGFTPNDIMGDGFVESPPDLQRAARARIRRFDDSPSKLLRLVWPRLVKARSALWPTPGSYEYVLEENYFRNPTAARRFAASLDELAQLTSSSGVCGHVFIHTRMNDLWLHPLTRIYDHVATLSRERGLTAQVSFPFFRGHDASDLRLSTIDTHPNAKGHRLHAEALVSGLAALPAHCFEPGHFEP